MKLYSPGDTSRAICAHCGQLVNTTFAYRDVPFDDGTGSVKDILVAVCDVCSTVVSIPAQSTPAIRHARETADIPLEVAIPASELEILDAAAYRVDPAATTRFRKSLFAFYLQHLRKGDDLAVALGQQFREWSASRKQSDRGVVVPTKRLSFKISPRTDRDLKWVMEAGNLKKTEAVRSIVMEIERELVVPDAPRALKQLQEIAAVVNA